MNCELLKINALELIPQREPMVLVDELIYYDSIISKTRFFVKPENIFVQNNRFSEYGILENIAQSCAVRIGYINLKSNEFVKLGFIGAIKDFEVFEEVEINKNIETTIEVISVVFALTLVKATVFQEEKLIAQCEMKVALSEINA